MNKSAAENPHSFFDSATARGVKFENKGDVRVEQLTYHQHIYAAPPPTPNPAPLFNIQGSTLEVQNFTVSAPQGAQALNATSDSVIKVQNLQAHIYDRLAPSDQAQCESKLKAYLLSIQADDVIQELQTLYIPGEASVDRYYTNPFNLESEIQSFLNDPHLTSLLLLGESGFGKTLCCQKLSLSLAREYEPGKPIPLYISLPSVPNVTIDIIKQFLMAQGFSEQEVEYLKKNREFIFILESYDEVASFKNNQLVNLYTANKLYEWKCKIITSCRTTYIIDAPQYVRYFCPYKDERMLRSQLKEIYVCPFSLEKIKAYIDNYLRVKREELQQLCESLELDVKWLSFQAYEEAFSELFGLRDIIKNPFLLRMTMDVLPRCHAEFKRELDEDKRKLVTSLDLYEKYIQAWFERQLDKLIWHTGGAPQYSNGQYMPEITVKDYADFSKELASKMEELGLVCVNSKDPRFKKFFDKSDERIVFIRKGVPLKNNGDEWSFIHLNFLHYFISLDGLEKQLALDSQMQGIAPK